LVQDFNIDYKNTVERLFEMIKKNIAIGVLAIIFIFTIVPISNAEPINFAVVNMKKVMETIDVAKNIFKQLDAKRKEFQKEISEKEKKLREEERNILNNKDNLSKNEFQNKRKEFEAKLLNGQKIVRNHKKTLDYALNNSINKLHSAVIKVVSEISKERGYFAVFTKETLVVSDPALDITEDVIARMNNKIQKFKVDWKIKPAPSSHSK